MDETIQKYLYDVLGAVEEINSYFDDKPMLFEEFHNNFMLRRAVAMTSPIRATLQHTTALSTIFTMIALRYLWFKPKNIITINKSFARP